MCRSSARWKFFTPSIHSSKLVLHAAKGSSGWLKRAMHSLRVESKSLKPAPGGDSNNGFKLISNHAKDLPLRQGNVPDSPAAFPSFLSLRSLRSLRFIGLAPEPFFQALI